MRKISIKTVDGGRFDYVDAEGKYKGIEEEINQTTSINPNFFIGFPVEGGTKFFNMVNVVSITEKEVDE